MNNEHNQSPEKEVTLFLTVQQPWASLIARWDSWDAYLAAGGACVPPKRIENRGWAPPARIIGHKIAIHAGKGWDDEQSLALHQMARDIKRDTDAHFHVPCRSQMPAGAVVAVARVTGYIDTRWDGEGPVGPRPPKLYGTLPRWAPQDLNELASPKHWFAGGCNVGWLLDDVVRLPEPVPMRGALGLKPMPAEVAAQVNGQLRHHLDQHELEALPAPPRAQQPGRWINKHNPTDGWWQEWVPESGGGPLRHVHIYPHVVL